MKRVLIAGLYHETHTFLKGLTRREDFEIKEGRALIESPGEGSPLAGAIEMARQLGWELVPAINLRALPGPIVADEVIELFRDVLQRTVLDNLARLDGIFLVLHGAMVSESCDDVEGEVLHRLRSLLGNRRIPVCGVVDLHANFTGIMAKNADALIAYRENPHTDAKDTAERAARVLDRLIQKDQTCTTLWEHPPILWPPTGTGTNANPMKLLEAKARQIEQRHGDILAVNVLAGFAFADIPEAGVSFTAVTQGDPDVARSELRHLARLAGDLKESGNISDMPVAEAMQRLALHRQGPVILVEPSDNIGGGAPGDGTGLLRALLEHHVKNAVVVVNDREAVLSLSNLAIGSSTHLSIGGKGSTMDAGPLALDVELLSRSDGRFSLEDPHSHLASMAGIHVEMGPCAVVRCEDVQILLTSRKTPPFDLGQLRSQGIIPEQQYVIVVKAAVAHRKAYDPIATASYWVDTPGPCASNLLCFPYRKVQRPVYPLD